jgi:hypothetical protein
VGFQEFLHAVKSYDMGPPALLPIRKESVLRIFIALKNPLPWPGSNPQPFCPVASTLITTPPRCQGGYIELQIVIFKYDAYLVFQKQMLSES